MKQSDAHRPMAVVTDDAVSFIRHPAHGVRWPAGMPLYAESPLVANAAELLKIADRFFSFYELHKDARGGQLGRDFEELRAKIMGEVKP